MDNSSDELSNQQINGSTWSTYICIHTLVVNFICIPMLYIMHIGSILHSSCMYYKVYPNKKNQYFFLFTDLYQFYDSFSDLIIFLTTPLTLMVVFSVVTGYLAILGLCKESPKILSMAASFNNALNVITLITMIVFIKNHQYDVAVDSEKNGILGMSALALVVMAVMIYLLTNAIHTMLEYYKQKSNDTQGLIMDT